MLVDISTSRLMALRDIVADRIRDQKQIQSFLDVTAGGVETTTEQLLTFLLNPAELIFCPRVKDGGRGPCVVHDGAIAASVRGPHEECIGCNVNVGDELRRVALRYLATKLALERLQASRANGNGHLSTTPVSTR